MSKLSKTKKFWISALTVVTVSVAGVGGYKYVEAQKQEEIRIENFQTAEKAINELYNANKENLKDGISLKDLDHADKLVSKLEGSNKDELSKEMYLIRHIFDTQQTLEGLMKNDTLIDDIDNEKLASATKEVDFIKGKNDKIYESLKGKLDQATEQFDLLTKAKAEVDKLEKKPTEKDYKATSVVVEKIKNSTHKKELTDRLSVVNKKIVAQKEEAIKQAQIQQQQNVAIQNSNSSQTQQSQVGTTVSNNSGQVAASQSTQTSQVQQSKSSTNSSNNNVTRQQASSSRPQTQQNTSTPVRQQTPQVQQSKPAVKQTQPKPAPAPKPSNSQPKPNTNMDQANQFVNDWNNGQYEHVYSGNNGTGNDYNIYTKK